jgi:N-acetylmuramoyl-L-alanine amidase
MLILLLSSCARKPQERNASIASRKLATRQNVPQSQNQKRQYSTPKEIIIVIDSGHGGQDPGSQSVLIPHDKEKTLTLRTALRVQESLKRSGYTVKMTRAKDVFIPLPLRVKFAHDMKAEIFVSIHFNHAPNAKAQGIEIYYYKSAKNVARSNQSKELATLVLHRIVATCQAPSRGVMHGDFHVVRETKIPAILIEGGFLSNQLEAKKLKSPQYVRLLALSIAKGIDDYARKNLLVSSK